MENYKDIFEATPDIDEAIKHLARIKLAKRQIEAEEKCWVDKIKSVVNLEVCDKIVALRDGEYVTVVTFKQPTRFDMARFKKEQKSVYNQYLVVHKPEDKQLYMQKDELLRYILKI